MDTFCCLQSFVLYHLVITLYKPGCFQIKTLTLSKTQNFGFRFMTTRTSALSRPLRSLVSCWNQYVIPSWRETFWNTSSKKEKVHVCSHIQLGTSPSKPCSLALKIMTTNKNITLPEIFLRAQPWGGVWWVHTVPTFPYGLNKPLTKTLINNVIIDSNDAHHMSLSSYYLQGSYGFLDPNYKTFSRLFSKTIIHFQTQGYQIRDQ